jgi:UrcA family protein
MTMKTSTSTQVRRILTATIFTVLTSGAAASFAADSMGVLQEKVAYGDLNVSSARGAATLYSRIRMAATDVCRPLSGDGLDTKNLWHKCVDNAIAGAVKAVGEPALTAVFNAKNGASKPIILASQQTR